MTDDQLLFADDHPVSGRREFGLEALPSGGYRFYTRGFDRPTNWVMEHPAGRWMQDESWSTLMEGLAEKYGGRSEHVDEYGSPHWGWHEHFSADSLLRGGVRKSDTVYWPESD